MIGEDSDEDSCFKLSDLEDPELRAGHDTLLQHQSEPHVKINEMPLSAMEEEEQSEAYLISSNTSERKEPPTATETVNGAFADKQSVLLTNDTMDISEVPESDIELGMVKLDKGYYKNYTADVNGFDAFLDIAEEDKFISTISQLSQLISSLKCGTCASSVRITSHKFVGSVAEIEIQCSMGHKVRWASSAMINKMYTTNFQTAVAIMLSGNLFVKISLLAKFMHLKFICESTFYRVIKLYMAPVVERWWQCMQHEILSKLGGTRVSVAADGRNDSPGHSATYCMYTFMEENSKLVLHQELVDAREVQLKSPNMERLGCERGLLFLLKEFGTIRSFVTDDHISISAMLGEFWYALLCMYITLKKS